MSKALRAEPRLKTHPVVIEFHVLLQAERARLAGRPEYALNLLRPLLTGHERYETRFAWMEAAADAGKVPLALAQSRWLQEHRGLAYAQSGCNQCLQVMNVADSNIAVFREAELLARTGRTDAARQALARFDASWSPSTLPLFLSERRHALLMRLGKRG